MLESLKVLASVLIEHPLGWAVLGCGGLALVQTALGIARSRQWSLLPLILGLTALVGFLINPLADATTSHQLRSVLSRHDVLTALAIAQMVLAAAAIAFNLRLSAAQGDSWWPLGLGLVHALPGPALIVAMLFWEHAWLERFVGARPEAVGRNVGLGTAFLLASSTAAAMAVPARQLTVAHCLVSGMVVLACMFVPLLPLPLPGMQLVIQPLDQASRVTWIAIVAVGAVFFLWGYRSAIAGDPLSRKSRVSLPCVNTN